MVNWHANSAKRAHTKIGTLRLEGFWEVAP